MTGGPPVLEIGAVQAIGTAVQSAYGTAATTGFTYFEWRSRAIKPVTGRKLYKTGAGTRGDTRKRGRSKSNTGGTFSLALQNIQGVELIAYTFGCDDVAMATHTHSTTLNGGVSAGAGSVVVTSATGFSTGTGYIQIGPDANGRSEVHAIGTVASTTINFANSEVLSRSYLTGVAAHEGDTTGTLTHTFSNALPVPYLTVVLDRSGQWYQVKDVQLDKLALALSGDDEWLATYNILGGNGFTEIATLTPTFATDINELNLADLTAATLLGSVPVTDLAMLTCNVSNNVKQGWTGGSYYPQKQKEGEFTIDGDIDVFFDAAVDETMVQAMVTGTEVNAVYTIGNHTITLNNANFLEPDWTDSLAELNRLKATYSVRAPSSSTWAVTSTSAYLPYV